MAKIAETKGRSDTNSGYARLFGSQPLGLLISRVHATVIRTGNELEHLIAAETPPNVTTTLETALKKDEPGGEPLQVVFQGHMPGAAGHPGGTIDIAIFDHAQHQIKVIELKDGDTFDTKKSSGELENLTLFAGWIAQATGYEAAYYFCSFNQDDKNAIVHGAKGRFDVSHAMIGQELCDILGIDYAALRERRQNQQAENLRYFLSELLKIQNIRQLIKELLKKS